MSQMNWEQINLQNIPKLTVSLAESTCYVSLVLLVDTFIQFDPDRCLQYWPLCKVMTSYNSCVVINWLLSSSFRWMLLPMCDASLQPAINCGHPVSGAWVCLLIGFGLIGFGPPQTVFQVLIFISQVVIVFQCQLILDIFHGFTWRWEQNNVLGNTVMHQLMAIQPQWRLTVYMGETAGQIFLGGCGGQIYGQHFRASCATFKLLCNETESFFVLIT